MKLVSLFLFALLFPVSAIAETQVYFSPNGGCEQHAVEMIDGTKSSLDVAMYSLNNSHIVSALENAMGRGVKIRILLDRVQAFGNRETTIGLKHDGFNVRLHSHHKIQHNKFAISDGREIMTGSFNWTTPAEESNEENCVFLDDPATAQTYQNQFDHHLWSINTEKKSRRYLTDLKRRATKKAER